jgi:hypothetical protein
MRVTGYLLAVVLGLVTFATGATPASANYFTVGGSTANGNEVEAHPLGTSEITIEFPGAGVQFLCDMALFGTVGATDPDVIEFDRVDIWSGFSPLCNFMASGNLPWTATGWGNVALYADLDRVAIVTGAPTSGHVNTLWYNGTLGNESTMFLSGGSFTGGGLMYGTLEITSPDGLVEQHVS